MTKEEFFRIWKRHCDDHDLSPAEGLIDAISGNELFTQDRLEDESLHIGIDQALGRWLVANDTLSGIFFDLEDEFKDAGPR